MSSKTDYVPLEVQYKFVNGSHFFVGSEGCKETEGLCVGSRNLKEAFHQVAPALKFLLARNHDIDTDCIPDTSYEQFLRWLVDRLDQELVSCLPHRDRWEANNPPVHGGGRVKEWTIPNLKKNIVSAM